MSACLVSDRSRPSASEIVRRLGYGALGFGVGLPAGFLFLVFGAVGLLFLLAAPFASAGVAYSWSKTSGPARPTRLAMVVPGLIGTMSLAMTIAFIAWSLTQFCLPFLGCGSNRPSYLEFAGRALSIVFIASVVLWSALAGSAGLIDRRRASRS